MDKHIGERKVKSSGEVSVSVVRGECVNSGEVNVTGEGE